MKFLFYEMPLLQRTYPNQGQIYIICLALNHSSLMASHGLHDETVNENGTPFENDHQREDLPRKPHSLLW